jgi:hypothetical protein
MGEVRAAEVIPHCRPRATGIDVRGAKMIDSIAVVNSQEVDAVPRDPARVRRRLMQVGSGKQDKPGRRANYLDLVWIHLFPRFWLLAGIRVDMLGRFNPASFIPFSVIIDMRIILDRSAKVSRWGHRQWMQ